METKNIKCSICNNEFSIDKKNVYQVTCGIGSFFQPKDLFDAIDCPYCGCQKLLCKRLPNANNKKEGEKFHE